MYTNSKREALSESIAELRHETAKLEMPETTWDHFVDLTNRLEAQVAELFEEHADDEMTTCPRCGDVFLHWQSCDCPRWAIFTRDGYRVQWLPAYDTEAEATAKMHEIGAGDGWDGPVEVSQI